MKKSYSDGEGPITFWGHAQEVDEIDEGVLNVSTASHGGILVSQEVAMKKLSSQARVIGVLFNGYYSYEKTVIGLYLYLKIQNGSKKANFQKILLKVV